MARQVLFVQGAGEGTYDGSDHKLVDGLRAVLGPDYEIRYPRMPNESDPTYQRWKKALEKELADLEGGAILVGHSVGGTILINALAGKAPQLEVGGIFLIAAPFVGEGGWPSDDLRPRDKLGSALPAGVPIYLYHGSDDETVPSAHVDLYAQAVPQAIVRRLKGRDHQLNDNLSEVAHDIQALS